MMSLAVLVHTGVVVPVIDPQVDGVLEDDDAVERSGAEPLVRELREPALDEVQP